MRSAKKIPIKRANVVSDRSDSIANLFVNYRPSFNQSFDTAFLRIIGEILFHNLSG